MAGINHQHMGGFWHCFTNIKIQYNVIHERRFFFNGLQLQHVFQAIINGWLMVLSILKNMSRQWEGLFHI